MFITTLPVRDLVARIIPRLPREIQEKTLSKRGRQTQSGLSHAGEHRHSMGKGVCHIDPPLLTKTDVEEIASGKAYVVVFMQIEYFDIHNAAHWVRYCFSHSGIRGTYRAKKCPDYNDAGNI